ncbi:Olfactory receptor 181 [Microtus ochrogaster]|uniref:Olfactory receptor 181 n=1 Tax=Microtus ochrogaster TaxID=79684 RepID=A0A8J6GQY7_MICOH|nr:Olfactory receptor 181 [Microtus ochrogaster]
MKKNNSFTTEFILIEITGHLELKIFLFLLFYAIYLVTMEGNLGLVALIYMEHHLHKPMYFFLGNLALMDSCCSCAITPKMLENFFSVSC